MERVPGNPAWHSEWAYSMSSHGGCSHAESNFIQPIEAESQNLESTLNLSDDYVTMSQLLPPFHPPGDDMRKLEAGVHIVSGTPGRVFDMIKRRSLRTRQIKTLVLDEGDEMLNKGFKEQIYDIYRWVSIVVTCPDSESSQRLRYPCGRPV